MLHFVPELECDCLSDSVSECPELPLSKAKDVRQDGVSWRSLVGDPPLRSKTSLQPGPYSRPHTLLHNAQRCLPVAAPTVQGNLL